MINDRLSGFSRAASTAAISLNEIAPDDTADLSEVTTALNVATPGQVRVTAKDGSISDVFIAAGHAFPLRVRKVWATGTTATGIRGLY